MAPGEDLPPAEGPEQGARPWTSARPRTALKRTACIGGRRGKLDTRLWSDSTRRKPHGAAGLLECRYACQSESKISNLHLYHARRDWQTHAREHAIFHTTKVPTPSRCLRPCTVAASRIPRGRGPRRLPHERARTCASWSLRPWGPEVSPAHFRPGGRGGATNDVLVGSTAWRRRSAISSVSATPGSVRQCIATYLPTPGTR